MTVPPPRDEPSWGDLVVDGLRDVKDELATLRRDMNAQMSVLVSQREFDRVRDDLTIDIGEVRGQIASGLTKHDADIGSVRRAADDVRKAAEAQVKALKDELAADRDRRRTERWAAIGALIGILGLCLTAITVLH